MKKIRIIRDPAIVASTTINIWTGPRTLIHIWREGWRIRVFRDTDADPDLYE